MDFMSSCSVCLKRFGRRLNHGSSQVEVKLKEVTEGFQLGVDDGRGFDQKLKYRQGSVCPHCFYYVISSCSIMSTSDI